MPDSYKFTCNECGWCGERYRNVKVCPKCGAPLTREDSYILCYHGTTEEKARIILRDGFKPDSWFALHMESALAFGDSTVIVVQFERAKIPKGWQFHVLESVPNTKIKKVLCIEVLKAKLKEE